MILLQIGRYYDASRTQDVFDSLGKHRICVSCNALIVFWRLDVPEDLHVEPGYQAATGTSYSR